MGLLESLGLRPAAAQSTSMPSLTPAPIRQGIVAQLVGANCVANLFDPGFPLAMHLKMLAKLGPGGTAPEKYKSLTALNSGPHPGARASAERHLLHWITNSFSLIVSYYGQTVEGYKLFMWKGVRMNGLNVVAGFTDERTAAEAKENWNYNYLSFGNTSKPLLTFVPGLGGWTTLEAALAKIPTAAERPLWLATVDVPSYPKADAPNEAAVLLMLAHPGYDTGRKPAALFGTPASVPHDKAQRRAGESARAAAAREAAEQALAACGIDRAAVGTLVRDCGRGSPEAQQRITDVMTGAGAVLQHLNPDTDLVDLAGPLGDLGANTVSYSLLMAAWFAHQRNKPALYVSLADPNAVRAMLVLPPPGHAAPAPRSRYPEARVGSQWYAAWWGQRLDEGKDFAD